MVFEAPALQLAIFGPKFQLFCFSQLDKIVRGWQNMSLLCLIKLIYPLKLVSGVRDTSLESCSVVLGAPALELANFGPKFQLFCFLQLHKIVKGWKNMSLLCLIKLIYPKQTRFVGQRHVFGELFSGFWSSSPKIYEFWPYFQLYCLLQLHKILKSWHNMSFLCLIKLIYP